MTDSRKRTRKGHLNKLSGGFGKKEQWNTYFFEALGGVYFHYRKDDRKEPTQILISSIVKVVPSSRGSVGAFEVHHKGKGSPWILDAETEEEMISWMEALVPDSSRQVKEDISRRKTLRALNPAGADDNNAQAQRYVQFSHPQQQQQYPQQQQPYPQQQQQYPQQQQQYPQQQQPYPQQRQPYPQQQQQYPQQRQPYPQQQLQHPQQRQPYPQQQQQYPQQQQPYPQQQQYPQRQQQYPQQQQQYHQQQQQYPQQQQQYHQQQQQYPQQQQPYPQQRQPYPQQQQQYPTQQEQYPAQQRVRSYTAQNPVNGTGQHTLDLSKSLPADAQRAGLQTRHLAVRNTGSLYLRKSPPPISPRPYEVFSPSPPQVQDGSYVIMTQAPEDVVPPPDSHTKGSSPSPKERPSDDQFRYFHSDQIPELAHLLEDISTAQGSTDVKPPINEKDQLDQTAVSHALGAVDLNLLEQTEDDDPKKKWTRATSIHPQEEENDLEESDCMDSLSREALIIYKSQLSDMEVIGKGQFGLVFHGKLRYSPDSQPIEVAVKSTKPSAKESEMKSFNKEIKTMASLCHPNVVKMYGVVEEAGSRKIVLEYLALGDLREFLKKNDRPVKRLVKYMYDVAAGMHYLASKGLVHRDLAARNVLVSSEEVCKVADMGLLREVDEQDLYMAQSALPLPLRWMAPECMEDLKFSTASDVWSFGVFMWELFHPKEKHPYPEMKNMQLKLKVPMGYTMEPPEDAPPIVKRIMKECWKLESDKRPSFLLISTLLFKCHLQLV